MIASDATIICTRPSTWIIPLKYIPRNVWAGGNREHDRRNFRRVATARERYWTGQIGAMWPRGWNSAWPGHPFSSDPRFHPTVLPPDEKSASEWVSRMSTTPEDARRQMKIESRENLTAVLDGLHSLYAPQKRTPVTRLLEQAIRQELTSRKQSAEKRDFIKFFYSNRQAQTLQLSEVLRDPAVFTQHPEPEVAAAIRVIHRFSPQIQSQLFNYAPVSIKVPPRPEALSQLLKEDPTVCPCRNAVRSPTPAHLHQGHVVTSDPNVL